MSQLIVLQVTGKAPLVDFTGLTFLYNVPGHAVSHEIAPSFYLLDKRT